MDESHMEQLFKGASAVIFAAPAPQGWESWWAFYTSQHMDYEECKRVAEVAVKSNVPRLVIIPCIYETRAFHLVAWMLLILFGQVIEWEGKTELETIKATEKSSTSYTIIRPGRLESKESRGLVWMQISQGGDPGSFITKDDVAAVTIAALKDDKTKNTVFEIKTSKQRLERDGDWSKLFQSLKPTKAIQKVGH